MNQDKRAASIYHIRPYRATDDEALSELLLPYFRDDLKICYGDARLMRVVMQMIDESTSSPEAFMLVMVSADDGDEDTGENRSAKETNETPSPRMAACLQAQVDRPDRAWCEREGEGFIQELVVRPQLRRRGHGRRLVEAAEERFRQLGITSVYLTVAGHAAFWEALGYRDSGKICRRNDCPIFTKKLRADNPASD